MVRLIAILVGLGFTLVLSIALISGAVSFIKEPPAETVEHAFHLHPREAHFASDGPFGRFDRRQLQRGFQVYKEVCAACHGLHQVAFRDLHDLGYTEAEVKAIANQWPIEVPSINPETGEPATRKGTPADKFPNPYANDVAARAANNNALPPDLSLIAKARHGGAQYIHSLLTGYKDAATYRNAEGKPIPKDNLPSDTTHFNPYFANLNIAMPAPLAADGQVTYADGTNPTIDQMAKDVSAFLVWTAEPKLEARHSTGIAVLIFLLAATVLAFLSKKVIWSRVEH